MKRQMIAGLAIVMLILTVCLMGIPEASAQVPIPAMADYANAPPFVSDAIAPNILILMDNSLSMQQRACLVNQCGTLPTGAISVSTYFVATTRYTGHYDSMVCYTYDTAASNNRFDPSSTKATLNAACPITEWDGNFLNWLLFRRFDAVKKAMIGADCNVARYSDGTCPATVGAGTIDPLAPLPTAPNPVTYTPTVGYKISSIAQRVAITAYTVNTYPGTLTATYNGVGGTVVNDFRGRVPDSVSQQLVLNTPAVGPCPATAGCTSSLQNAVGGVGNPLRFYVRNDSGATNFTGWFCVENDAVPYLNGRNCGDFATTVGGSPAGWHDTCNVGWVANDNIWGPACVQHNHPGRWSTVCDQSIEGVCVQSHQVWNPPFIHMHNNQVIDTPAVPGVTTYVPDIDPFVEQNFQIKWTTPTQNVGVIQIIGQKARFGLMVFKDNSLALDGARVLVGLGGRQSIDFNAVNVETFKTNIAAMVDAVGELFPKTQTPLGEGLYEALRYVAQIQSAYQGAPTYTYPIAFSGGNSGGTAYANAPGVVPDTGRMGTRGLTVGSLDGGKEVKAINTVVVPAETCPAGYIANACGRDPYFFGADPTYPWSGTSTVVTCCRTFIIVFTDGSPALDTNVAPAMQDVAHSWHGTHCEGPVANSPANIPGPGTTAFTYAGAICPNAPATPVATLLATHKLDYGATWVDNDTSGNTAWAWEPSAGHYLDDIAFYGHTTDLRQPTIPGFGVRQWNASTLRYDVVNGDESGHDLLGVQNVDVYTFFAFGNIDGRELLMHTAKVGAFEDRNANGVPDLPEEYDLVDNATGAAVPDGIPDAYFESSSVDDLQDKILATITNILSKSSSGTSVSVLATSSTGEGALYQSFFFPKTFEGATEIKWTGYTQALFLDAFGNLREDSSGAGTPDGRLVYNEDRIIKTRYDATLGEVLADLYVDANADGVADLIDTNADGIGDTPQTPTTISLKQIKPLWEAGDRLTSKSPDARSIWTWVDDGDGVVEAGEQMELKAVGGADNRTALRPFLRAADDNESAAIINFIRGCDPSDCAEQIAYRTRKLTVGGVLKLWKFGDPIHSTPTIVGAPRERYDVLYGDTSYNAYFIKYRTRRQVALVGANDGMLHAFNASFYNTGDDPSTPASVEHGWFTTTPVDPRDVALPPLRTPTPALGDELWGFVPREVLPHLKWLTDVNYTHVTYVDLKPKVTDARVFCDAGNPKVAPNCFAGQAGVEHPNGWGTIVIGGLRMGGSCGNCSISDGARPMQVDLNNNGMVDTGETFYSSYFMLDITEPELPPKLLWTFSDSNLGLTTSEPGIVRVKPVAGDKNDNDTAKWFMVVGSGPTGYSGSIAQTGKIFLVDLERGPKDNTGADIFNSFQTPTDCAGGECSFLGKPLSMDMDLDNRVDVIYIGSTICNSTTAPCNGTGTPPWTGKMYRFTTAGTPLGSNPDPCQWGIDGGGGLCANRIPTVLLKDFVTCSLPAGGCNPMGPVTTQPVATRDDSGLLWVFFGTGRYYSAVDRNDAYQQYFFGVKDPVLTGGCLQSSATNCERDDLVNVSSAVLCVICTSDQVTGVTGVDEFDVDTGGTAQTLIGLVASKDGWFTTLPDARERDIVTPSLVGGIIFFTSFVPDPDMCKAAGSSFLYALYYKTGTAYKEGVIGTEDAATNSACTGATTTCNVKRRQSLGTAGMGSAMALHVGAQGSGGSGSTSSGGCQGRLTGFVQASTGDLSQYCVNAKDTFSRYISWISQRD